MLGFHRRNMFLSFGFIIVLAAAASQWYSHNRTPGAWPAQRYSKQGRGNRLVQFFETGPLERGKTLHILGERHSGTRWIYHHLSECFNSSITVTQKLTRWKHWFQYEEDVDAFNDLYVVTMFRNPYDWVELMRRVPNHAPLHRTMGWNDFVETPWTMPRSDRDLEMVNGEDTRNRTAHHRVCDQAFYYNEVVPCVEEERSVGHAKYELRNDMSGEAYESILQLRRDKILNFLSIEQYQGVKYFDAWKYEDLAMEGSAQLVRQLEAALGIKATCKPLEPSANKYVQRPKLDLDYVQWMQDHVDWDDSEALVGYHRTDY